MDLDVILESSDWKLAKKLRHEDPEQFYTLVRMHLSFVLDLTTEDCECPAEKDKLRQLLKWGLAPFTKKLRAPTKIGLEGQPLTKQGIGQVYKLIEFLSKEENIVQEGIFRRSGKMTRQQELKSLLNQGIALDLDEGQFSVHDCASVLKSFLADLHEPLLTETYYPAYCQIAELCISEKSSEERLQRALQLLLLLLPEENWLLLKDVITMLHLTASLEGQNKMSAENLATLFTPHLLCPRKLSPESLHTSSQMLSHVVIFMIRSGLQLFQVPPTLATDIYAYWERKKLSSQIDGNESSAANTVFSFVDRERTAQENITNPTEAALAQLYAYIQSLPESNKKRRLVKQFNKENGYGTPRHTTSRTCSIGDSIKKRIFSKSSKSNKPLLENNLLKSGRYSSEEILDSPEYMKSMTPKVKLTFNKSSEEADSSVDNSESSSEKFKEYSDIQEKENVNNNVITNFVKTSEDDPDQQSPLLFSSSCPATMSMSNDKKTTAVNPSVVTATVSTASVQRDGVAITTPENKSTFFTPPTPVSLKHRHWSINRPTCSTPNSKQWNNSMLLTSTPACNNCLHSTSPMVASADDMSPITRSTQRMTKAMQETMMTPRSRKPVVALSGSNICHLTNMTWGIKESSMSGSENHNGNVKPQMSFEEDSLTSPFRDYLLSRSILTTSPVDLSFSSRTGDFDPSSFSDDLLPSSLNESLLHCMDGNCVGMSSDCDSMSSRKRDASMLDDELLSKRERSSSTSGHSTESSKEAVFETSL